VAFDGRGHRLLRDGVVVVEGDRILHVGPRFEGAVDETVDARDRVLTPGLISTHAHIGGSPLDRSFIEDRGRAQFWYSGLFEMLPVRSEGQDEEGGRACVDFSMVELLRGGVTTVMEIGSLGEYVVERAAHYGLRVYVGQAFRSGRWLTRDGKRVVWEWSEEQGRQGLRRAVDFHRRHDGAHGGLVRCFFAPAQIDTCTPELLKEAKRHADEARVPYQVHTSQSVVEFNEMVARHGQTPIAWMRELGVLGPNTILGHAIIVGGSSWTNYPAGDVRIMAESGCSVAHAVWVFARRGVAMESFARYREAGINMSLGTDTNPQSVIEAMRWAAVCSKMMERNTEATTAADAFDAATLGGARALGRDDLGRIAPGAKADLVLWKAASWRMTPLRDPIKNIVYNAGDEDVDRVYVNGRLVVDGGRVLAADERAILSALQAAGERMWPRMAKADWAGRGADELSPQTYADWTP
jgi:cytosine/adenosine deaminase-related metal-dependent hydrolase